MMADAAFCMQCGAPIDRDMETVVNPTSASEQTEEIQKEAETAETESIMKDAVAEEEEKSREE